jgi:hypothetical protein
LQLDSGFSADVKAACCINFGRIEDEPIKPEDE